MSSRGNGEGEPWREHEIDVTQLDIDCQLAGGLTVRPILTVVSDARTRMIVEVTVSLPSEDGPAAA